jgi:hypothetical protein
MRNFYAARPINTYDTPLGGNYLNFLRRYFPEKIIDPNSSEVTSVVDAIKVKYPVREDYDKFGAKEVMDYFARLVLGVNGGAGLALPVLENNSVVFKLPAGVAKELAVIHGNGYPTWIVTCTKRHAKNEDICPHAFKLGRVTSITEEEVSSMTIGGKETLYIFATKYTVFTQLTIQQTRECIYFWPDRTRMRPYFLDDAI